MYFATPLPWWLAVLLAVGVAGVASLSYRRPLVPLSRGQQVTLVTLRALVLGLLILFLFRPVILGPPLVDADLVVPVLVDTSRSMRIADADGQPRIERAKEVLRNALLPVLNRQGRPELFSAGDILAPATVEGLTAGAGGSDLTGALAALRDRYRGRRTAGVLLLSDGGNTGQPSAGPEHAPLGPIFVIGLGSTNGPPDREIRSLTTGDPRVDQTSVDLHVSAVSRGFGREPFLVRLFANGSLLDGRRIVPVADGSPADEVFTVFPDPSSATVYTAEIGPETGEQILENNRRSVLVSPAGRRRRILAVAGAPGFEHSFLIRALSLDPSLELDSVVRKGRTDAGESTFLVQAHGGRAATLTSGFPVTREALYLYDTLIVANVEGDFFTRAQLSTIADFVAQRGGGVLILGGRSFAQRGLIGTPLEEVVPLELNDRRGSVVPLTSSGDAADVEPPHNGVRLTADGERHPVTRLGRSPEESRKVWATLPALASTALLGGPRPGALVLAVTTGPSGRVLPIVAVQRYGRGRSMVFAGEASWRWKMMMPAADRSYEFFWRQAIRWLSTDVPDPVAVIVSEHPAPGEAVSIDVEVRDHAFLPARDATLTLSISQPGGETAPIVVHPTRDAGHFSASFTPERPGLYHATVTAKGGGVAEGAADRWFHVGDVDREFVDPRLNEGFLRRLARDSGGQYLAPSDAARALDLLASTSPRSPEPQRRDLWHEPWAYITVIGLLSTEWILRRRWGLR